MRNFDPAYVSSGPLADMAAALPNVRLNPNSGPRRHPNSCLLSANIGHWRIDRWKPKRLAFGGQSASQGGDIEAPLPVANN